MFDAPRVDESSGAAMLAPMKTALSLLGSRLPGCVCADLGLAFFRVFLGLAMALAHGMGKVPPKEGFVGYLEGLGLPAPGLMAWLAGLAEFAGGLLLAAGLLTRFAAFSILVTMAVAAFLAHGADGFSEQEMALLYLFGCLPFLLAGGGRFSADNALGLK
jgi:putative oxidoreductase